MGKTSYNSGLHIVALPKRWCDKYGLALSQPINYVSSKLNISSCSLGVLNGLEITIDTDLSQRFDDITATIVDKKLLNILLCCGGGHTVCRRQGDLPVFPWWRRKTFSISPTPFDNNDNNETSDEENKHITYKWNNVQTSQERDTNLVIEILVHNKPPERGAPLACRPNTRKHCASHHLQISSWHLLYCYEESKPSY